MTDVENDNKQFDAVFKKFDEIEFHRQTIEDLTLHTIPSGSQEFQKVLWTCDDSEKKQNSDNEERTFRQRSHTIDSTYVKPKKHHVHFPSSLETPPMKLGSSESIDGTRHGILIRHNEDSTGRERSNTIDTVYKKDRKFITIPQNSRVHHSSSDSIEEETENREKNKSKSVHSPKRKISVVERKTSRTNSGKSSTLVSSRKTSVGESPLCRSNTSSPHRKHSQSNHRVH